MIKCSWLSVQDFVIKSPSFCSTLLFAEKKYFIPTFITKVEKINPLPFVKGVGSSN